MGLKLLKSELADDNANLNRQLLETMDDIEHSCDTSLEILNDLLSYEKLDAGILQLERKSVLVYPLLRDTARPFQIQVCSVAYLPFLLLCNRYVVIVL